MKKVIFIILAFGLFVSCNQNEAKDSEPLTEEASNPVEVDFYGAFESNSQFFNVRTDKKTEIKGEQGTIIVFPKGCFNTKEKEVKIELKECYSIPDMIKNNLSTITTKNEILESDGMIYVNATAPNGDTLDLVKSIRIETVTRKKDSQMQIFDGKKDRSIVWELSKSKIEEEKPIKTDIAKIEIEGDSIIKGKPIIEKSVIGKPENYRDYIYSFITDRLGWINADKYNKTKRTEIEITVADKNEPALYYLVFDNYVALLSGLEKNGKIEFIGGNQLPKNETGILIGLMRNPDESYNFASININTTQKSHVFPKLKKVSKQELDKILLEKFGKDIWSRPMA
jgi:hypothetical protein